MHDSSMNSEDKINRMDSFRGTILFSYTCNNNDNNKYIVRRCNKDRFLDLSPTPGDRVK